MTTTVPKPRRRPSLRERLLSKAIISWETGCWEWNGCKGRGYGQINIKGRMRLAHRVAYELIEGPIPAGLQLDHLCRNRACINPAHLEPVTARENLLRSPITLASQFAAKTHCPQNHEFTVENTIIRPNGGRSCRICCRAAVNRYAARRRAARQEVAA